MSCCYRCYEEFDRTALLIEMDGGLCHVRCLTPQEREGLKGSHYWSLKHLEELERIEAEAAQRPAPDRPGIAEMLQAAGDRGLLQQAADAHRRIEEGSLLEEAFSAGIQPISKIARYQEGVFRVEIEEGDLFEIHREGEKAFFQLDRQEIVDLFWELVKVIGDDPTWFEKGKEGKVQIRVEVSE